MKSALSPRRRFECGMSKRTLKSTLTPHPALSPFRGEGIQPATQPCPRGGVGRARADGLVD